MEKNKTIGIFALAAVVMLSLGMVSAFGNGFMSQNLAEEELTERDAQREGIREAVEDGDYSTWKSFQEERIEQMKNQITEENFNQMMEKHQEMKALRVSGEFQGKGAMKGNRISSGECPMLSE